MTARLVLRRTVGLAVLPVVLGALVLAACGGGQREPPAFTPPPTGVVHGWAVDFVDQTHGWAVGEAGTVVATSDGGRRWLVQHRVGEGAFWFGVDFVDRLHGWVVGSVEDDTLLHTDDGGATWVRQRHADLREGLGLAQAQRLSTLLRDVAFTGETRGFAVGGDGVSIVGPYGFISATADGGGQWTLCDVRGSPDGLAADYVAALAFSGAERGCAVGGHIYATSDGGASWVEHESVSDRWGRATFVSVYFGDRDHGWVVGDDGRGRGLILATSDGGVSWHRQRTPAVPRLLDVVFCDVSPEP